MLEPLSTLHTPGLDAASRAPQPESWTPELITGLDWMLLAELVRGVVADAGCQIAGSQVLIDGSVLFGMMEGTHTASPQRVLVKTCAWDEWAATAATVERFAREVLTAKNARGILVAPAGFSTAALQAARQHRIETVDAATLHSVLKAMPTDRQEFFRMLATAGEYQAPSCPVCLKKLVRRTLEFQAPVEMAEEMLILSDAIVAEPVFCSSLRIARHCEVQFLRQVRAQQILIEGTATGDVICEGKLVLGATGVVHGRVTARSLDVAEGAQLLAETQILVGQLEPMVKKQVEERWICRGTGGQEGCSRIRFDVRGPDSASGEKSGRRS